VQDAVPRLAFPAAIPQSPAAQLPNPAASQPNAPAAQTAPACPRANTCSWPSKSQHFLWQFRCQQLLAVRPVFFTVAPTYSPWPSSLFQEPQPARRPSSQRLGRRRRSTIFEATFHDGPVSFSSCQPGWPARPPPERRAAWVWSKWSALRRPQQPPRVRRSLTRRPSSPRPRQSCGRNFFQPNLKQKSAIGSFSSETVS